MDYAGIGETAYLDHFPLPEGRVTIHGQNVAIEGVAASSDLIRFVDAAAYVLLNLLFHGLCCWFRCPLPIVTMEPNKSVVLPERVRESLSWPICDHNHKFRT